MLASIYMISIIAVIGKNRELGCGNKLLWKLPEDLKHFKKLTMGHTIIMGRKTLESIGHTLPGRFNIVVTKQPDYHCPDSFGKDCQCMIAHDLKDALHKAAHDEAGETFVIGGAQIFADSLPYAKKLYLTIVDDAPEADAYFPDYSEFKNIISEESAEDNGYKLKYLELSR